MRFAAWNGRPCAGNWKPAILLLPCLLFLTLHTYGQMNAAGITGNVTDQSGAIKLPAGQVMDDGTLASLQWLVQGIEGKLS